jgi:leucine dehydrogenase
MQTLPFDHEAFDHHETVSFFTDPDTGLETIIAIHSTHLGPSLGGVRFWHYANRQDALRDVLRLSAGMSYKNAMANLPLGGGKAVILANPDRVKSEDMLRAFGQAVERLGGQYITAEDVGMSQEDMDLIQTETSHVTGVTSHGLGDPSPYTAHGVMAALKACLTFQEKTGSESLEGKTIAIQGLGSVGADVAKRCLAQGAQVIASDLDAEKCEKLHKEEGVKLVEPNYIHAVNADIFMPCALGAVLNSHTIPQIKAKIIVGAANNQLERPDHADLLHARGILYAPDYIANAGGVISIGLAQQGQGHEDVLQTCEDIGATLLDLFQEADKTDQTPAALSLQKAKAKIGR